ncbi:hypothetical protein BDQ17DRAFT_1340741 [Cyathus striatus]|nr:hypothetical protein BDQ17DRAFT_1340741 [Cyathus striatus]
MSQILDATFQAILTLPAFWTNSISVTISLSFVIYICFLLILLTCLVSPLIPNTCFLIYTVIFNYDSCQVIIPYLGYNSFFLLHHSSVQLMHSIFTYLD